MNLREGTHRCEWICLWKRPRWSGGNYDYVQCSNLTRARLFGQWRCWRHRTRSDPNQGRIV